MTLVALNIGRWGALTALLANALIWIVLLVRPSKTLLEVRVHTR